ncbi:MAG TPA: GAF domain-containing sensor histidine kinase [Thermomicrobiales bacterium]|jgi:signal transduction histidine kinase
MAEVRQRAPRSDRRGARKSIALTGIVAAGGNPVLSRDRVSSPRFDPWRIVADTIDARMHRPPRSLRFYLISAAIYAFLSYLAVQLVYDWELDRAGLHAKGFHPETVFRNTYAVHAVSFGVWLSIALITGAIVHRVQSTLTAALVDTDRRAEEMALISRVGAATSEPLPPTRMAADFLQLVREVIAPSATVTIAAFDEGEEAFSTLAVDGPRASEMPSLAAAAASVPSEIRGRLLGSFRPLFLPDTVVEPATWATVTNLWPHLASARCFCLLPLVSRDRPVGALILRDDAPNRIDDDQVRLLTSLSQYLAGALDNASLVANAEARADREARVNEELQRLNQAKSDFVSIVAHEFRTPLTGIQGFSEIIRDYELTMDEAREYAADIHADAKRLTRMINSQLDLDRLQSGQIDLELERVQLNDVVTAVVDLTRTTAPDHRLVLDLNPELDAVIADRDRLIQIVTNLLNNAVKYSPDGGDVVLRTCCDVDRVHLAITDHGVGIPAPALERIFEPYTRIETGPGGRVAGTGLGLPIVRQIVTLHGGRVWAESEPGEGSTFHVTLPVDPDGAVAKE